MRYGLKNVKAQAGMHSLLGSSAAHWVRIARIKAAMSPVRWWVVTRVEAIEADGEKYENKVNHKRYPE
jgi:hypothetical protein